MSLEAYDSAAPRQDKVKFAVVREDASLELELVQQHHMRHVLGVVSGGCTLLSLRAKHPELYVAGFDMNPLQIALTQRKARAAEQGDRTALNVEADDPAGLNQSGDFERVFRVLLAAFHELVAPRDQLTRFFDPATSPDVRRELVQQWRGSLYWPVIFEAAFSDPMVRTMFGLAAVQHAPPGSYPAYFQAAITRGLSQPDAHRNPFLQHIFLQKYLPPDAPLYARGGGDGALLPQELVCGVLQDVPELERFDLIQLSNLFDWLDESGCEALGRAVSQRARAGAVVLIRQLNNTRDMASYFGDRVVWDGVRGRAFWERERSMFYAQVCVGVVR